MRLCAVRSNWPGNPTIYVNPMNVVALHPSGQGTLIVTNSPNEKGHYTVYAPDTAENVAASIEAAMKD